jgi:hypothetical protein
MKTRQILTGLILLPALTAIDGAQAQSVPPSPAGNAVPVTADNFIRAESDMYFGTIVKQGGFGKFFHQPQPMPIDKQDVVRANRDTLYSGAVCDLDAGPVTITLSHAGERFMSMQVIDALQGAIKAGQNGPGRFAMLDRD